MKKLATLFSVVCVVSSLAQNTDTIKVMAYNLLNFPAQNSARISDLKTIVQDALPDIFMVCELTSSTGANGILNNALNQNGITYYNKATYVAGPDTQNMLFYNSDKLGLAEQNEITTALRDINEYVLYYKSTDIATTSDTTFFYVYVCHLKASQGYEADRNGEALSMKNYMATRSNLENVLVGGDFNLYGSSEAAWNTILSGAGVTLVDPVNTPGEWHADWGYATLHTQSTRTTSIDGGSSGGMDDRFDFIFMSPDLMNWGNQARYISGTYWAYGQDGNHYNTDINASPTNISRPASVIDALYYMSDHLPVYAEIEVQTVFNEITEVEKKINAYYNAQSQQIQFQLTDATVQVGEIRIYDLSGKLVLKSAKPGDNQSVNVASLEKGMYILQLADHSFTMKFVR